jgi:hypothetical protein
MAEMMRPLSKQGYQIILTEVEGFVISEPELF